MKREKKINFLTIINKNKRKTNTQKITLLLTFLQNSIQKSLSANYCGSKIVDIYTQQYKNCTAVINLPHSWVRLAKNSVYLVEREINFLLYKKWHKLLLF